MLWMQIMHKKGGSADQRNLGCGYLALELGARYSVLRPPYGVLSGETCTEFFVETEVLENIFAM